ncbi:MAG: hypothetical protein EBS05_08255 [Proteobacteria bacterium]|nr:hypothetical protein [Pseudomonadota bacterium]
MEVTNTFNISSNGVVGALIDDGLKTYLDGLDLTFYGAANPPSSEFQLPFLPFLGKGSNNIPNVGTFTGVSGVQELVIEGDPAFTNDVVAVFTISATDTDTGEPIPDADIVIAVENVTNGVAYASFMEHSTNAVGVDITGHDNWTAILSAAIIRAEIWVDEVAWFGVDTNSSGSGGCADPETGGTILLVQAPMIDLSDKTKPSVVGKNMTLRAFPLAAQSYSWSIGGSTVSNFVVGATNGGPVFEFPTNNQTITFAWWKPGTNTITLITNFRGKTMQRKCKFEVADPPVSVSTDTGTIALDSNHPDSLADSLHFGTPSGNPGVRFTHTGTPQIGAFQWVQIANSSVSKLNKSGNHWKLTASGLDSGYPYSPNNPADDSPLVEGYNDEAGGSREPLDGAYNDVEANDSFTMYLMYMPGGNDVWVPIRQVDWSWSARAVNGEGGWSFPVAPAKNVPAAIRATGWPTWNQNVVDSNWQPD